MRKEHPSWVFFFIFNGGLMSNIVKTLPHDSDVERALLGAILVYPEIAESSFYSLTANDFYNQIHSHLFLKIKEYIKNSSTYIIEWPLFKNYIESVNDIDKCGGEEYIKDLINSAPISMDAHSYFEIVREKSLRRMMIKSAQELEYQSFDLSTNSLDVCNKFSNLLMSYYTLGSKGGNQIIDSRQIKELDEKFFDELNNNRGNEGIKIGFPVIDSKTGGFRKGQLIVISGRTGTGKTAFAISCILNILNNYNGKVRPLFFSYEMDFEEIIYRMLSNISLVPHYDILNQRVKNDEDREKISRAFDALYNMDFLFVPSLGMRIADLRTQIKNAKKDYEGGAGIVFIDYLSLIDTSNLDPRTPGFERVGYISRTLKQLARDENIPIVVLSQLNRAAETEVPTVANLSGGSIEQDADSIIILFDPNRNELAKEYAPDTTIKSSSAEDLSQADLEESYKRYTGKRKNITVHLSKQRNGATGFGQICFMQEVVRFCNYEYDLKKSKHGDYADYE